MRLMDAAATPHGVDRYLELFRPSWSSTEIRAKVVRVVHSTPRAVTVTVRPNGLWSGFVAGQYTQLTAEIDGVLHTRCYSMANSAATDDGTLEFSITAQPAGRVSRHLHAAAHRGMTVRLTPAQGAFTLPVTEPARMLLVSAGSGITPVMSMLRTRCDLGWSNPVTFLHYARNELDMLYRDELHDVARTASHVKVVRVFTERPGAGDMTGHLCPDHLDQADPGWLEADTYVCGPGPLMETAKSLFAGADAHRFHSEPFTLPEISAQGGTAGGSLRFGRSGIVVHNDGSPLLALAEGAGLSPRHGCRIGICHTCTCRLTQGVVRNVVTGELTEGPNPSIRICVNAPLGDVEVDL